MEDREVTTLVETAIRSHGPAFKRFVQARAHSSDVDDILQNAAMRALEKAGDLREPDRVLAWLYRIHHNAVIDFGRTSTRQQRLKEAFAAEQHAGESSIFTGSEAGSTCNCVTTQARRLNSGYTSILDIVYFGGATLKEAARKLNVTVNTATVRLHRARLALKERLLNHCGVKSVNGLQDCLCTDETCCAR
ncbi:MAG: sigma-70 family RNA polymerase sigma factor [Pseudomonadota bacterium]